MGNCGWTKTTSASSSESLLRWCWSDVKWQTVPYARSSSRKRPITDGGEPSWRYDQCGRWRRSQSLPWTDVGYTSKFVRDISVRDVARNLVWRVQNVGQRRRLQKVNSQCNVMVAFWSPVEDDTVKYLVPTLTPSHQSPSQSTSSPVCRYSGMIFILLPIPNQFFWLRILFFCT